MPEAHAARPSWDECFMGLTREVAKRATCDRGRSGCIVVKQKRIVATGYVGSPPGTAYRSKAPRCTARWSPAASAPC